MTDNIVSAITRFLSPEVVGKIASASGLERDVAQEAVNASVPAILSGLTELASQPGGAKQLANAIADQPAGMLGNLVSSLTGSAQLADKGTSLLSSLLGSSSVGTLASTVSRFIGSGEGSIRTMMGLLTPVILGVLGREQRAAGLDTGGLARMLTDQKDNIASAMPAGLSWLLPKHDTAAAATAAPRAATAPAQRIVPEAKTSQATWPYWVLPLLALAALGWYLMPHDTGTTQQASETTPPAATSTRPAQPSTLVANTQGRTTFFSRPNDDWISIEAFQSQDIYNREGEKLGTVTDLLLAPDGRVNAAIVSIGNFLGIGEKRVAVPFVAVTTERRDNGLRLVVDAKKETLQAAPAFEQPRDRMRFNVPKLPVQDGQAPKN
jgi:sporulation protein YlmC with PRC-barrel domain